MIAVDEALDCIAVEFRTHRMNTQSRRAIERLGAQLDGILRAHQRAADGSLRDTAVYSITAAEWPAVRSHLAGRHGLKWTEKQHKARLASGTIRGQRVVLAKPFTFMNDSGQSVAALVRWLAGTPGSADHVTPRVGPSAQPVLLTGESRLDSLLTRREIEKNFQRI